MSHTRIYLININRLKPFQIHLRYAKVNEDPMEDPPRDDEVTEYMTAAPSVGDAARRPEHLAFPLMGKVQEIELGGLSKGWYLVCGEAVRTDDNVVLERDCLWARIFEVQEEGRSSGFGEYPTLKWNQNGSADEDPSFPNFSHVYCHHRPDGRRLSCCHHWCRIRDIPENQARATKTD